VVKPKKKDSYNGPPVILYTQERLLFSLDLEGKLTEIHEYKQTEKIDGLSTIGSQHFQWNGKEAFCSTDGIHLFDYKDYSITTLSTLACDYYIIDNENDTLYATAKDWCDGPTQKIIRIEKNGTTKDLFDGKMGSWYKETGLNGNNNVVVFVKGCFIWIGAGGIICSMDLNGKIKKHRDIVNNGFTIHTFDSKNVFITTMKSNGNYLEVDLENESVSEPKTTVNLNLKMAVTNFGDCKVIYSENGALTTYQERYLWYYDWKDIPKKLTNEKQTKKLEHVICMIVPNAKNQ